MTASNSREGAATPVLEDDLDAESVGVEEPSTRERRLVVEIREGSAFVACAFPPAMSLV